MTRAARFFWCLSAACAAVTGVAARTTAQTPPARPAAQGTPAAQAAPTAADVSAAIDQLGAFDFATRMRASRVVRRAAPALAIPALTTAAKGHADTYVRYRALVLLAGLDDPATPALMTSLLADKNDRVRAVAYAWFEHNPSPAVLPALLNALPGETSEFVRPSLTRALAAAGADPRVRAALSPLIGTGEDFFRGEVIQALGDYRNAWARAEIVPVAKLDGPLRDDAVLALGNMGDAAAVPPLAELQRAVPREGQPAIAAALCLLGSNCDAHRKYLGDTIKFAADNSGFQRLLRSSAQAAGALAARGDQAAFAALFDAGVPAVDPARAPIALALGTAAVRDPAALLAALAARRDQPKAIELLQDAFDMLDEDFEEELFYVAVRRAYWAAAEGSAARKLAEAVIQKLEF